MIRKFNKKLFIIAVLFSIVMVSGSVFMVSSGHDAKQNDPDALAGTGMNGISYQDKGNISAAGYCSNVTVSNNGINVGYAHIYRYLGYKNLVYFSTSTFVNETGSTIDFADLGGSISDFDYGAYYGSSGGLSSWADYGLSDLNSTGAHSLKGIEYDGSGNVTYIILSSPDNGTFRFNLSLPVYISSEMPYRSYSTERIVYDSVTGGMTDVNYNPYSNLIYIPSQFTDTLYILNGSTYSFVGNVTENMTNVFSALYNPYNHYEYIASFSDGLTIMNGTHIIVSGLNSTFGPIGLAYDSLNHDVYATSINDKGMAVYHNSSYVASISYNSDAATGSPFSAIYDKFNGMIYSTYVNSSSDFGIIEINPDSNSIVKFIQTKYLLDSLLMDNPNREIYAASSAYAQFYTGYGTQEISIYSDNFTFIGNLANVDMQMGMSVINRDLYVEGNDSSLFVFSPENSLVYEYKHLNPENHLMGAAYDNLTGKLIIGSMSQSGNNYPVYPTKLIDITPFSSLDVKEYGLPKNSEWPVLINSIQFNATGGEYNFSLLPGSYNISVPGVNYMYPEYVHMVSLNGIESEIVRFNLKGVKIEKNSTVLGYWVNNSLSNGNFTSGGYNFTEKIYNQTAIFISTTSVHAPNVTLSFKVSQGLYNIIMSNGTSSKVINTTSPVNGYINVTYNPGKMPLDPIFSLTPVTCAVAPLPPPLPPGGPISVIEHPEKYFDYSIWTILMWVGITAVAALAVIYVVRRR